MLRRLRFEHAIPFLIAIACVSYAGCLHKNPNVVTAAGKKADNQTSILNRIDEFGNTIIDLNHEGALPKATADIYIKFCKAATITVNTATFGWQAAVQAAWQQAKTDTPPADLEKVKPYITVLDAVIRGLSGEPTLTCFDGAESWPCDRQGRPIVTIKQE